MYLSAPRYASPRCNSASCKLRASNSDTPQPIAPWPSQPVHIPDLRRCKHYINLTNGLEALPTLHALHLPYQYVRIQSTQCEQQHFEQLCSTGLGPDLLFHLAMGHTCLVWDFGSRNKKRGVPRALWYGLEFVRFALALTWFDHELPCYLRGHNATRAFRGHYGAFGQSTIKMLRYYKKYIATHTTPFDKIHPNTTPIIPLYGVYRATEHDRDDVYYTTIAHTYAHAHTHAQQPQQSAVHIPMQPPQPTSAVQVHELGGPLSSSSEGPLSLEVLGAYGYGVFGGGVGHAELRRWQQEHADDDGGSGGGGSGGGGGGGGGGGST